MSACGKKIYPCWGKSQTYDRELYTSQGPCPLAAASFSCFWKLWLEALVRGVDADHVSVWDNNTTIATTNIPEDIHDNLDIMSMTDLLALMDIHPEDTFYPRALCTAFLTQFAFEDTKISMEEMIQRLVALKAIKIAQQAPPAPAGRHPALCLND
jgi:hypothetical protein